MKKQLLAVALAISLVFAGCSVSQFEAVLNEIAPAVLTILQIVQLLKGGTVNTAAVSKISADVAGLEKLYSDWQAADAANQGSVAGQINAGFSVLTQDLTQVLSIAQVSDPNTQAKITALIGLIETAVNIAEAAIPATKARATLTAIELTANGLADSYDKILVARTGNATVDAFTPHHKIHNHGKFVRVVTAGVAK
jgi:hypothetical protein